MKDNEVIADMSLSCYYTKNWEPLKNIVGSVNGSMLAREFKLKSEMLKKNEQSAAGNNQPENNIIRNGPSFH